MVQWDGLPPRQTRSHLVRGSLNRLWAADQLDGFILELFHAACADAGRKVQCPHEASRAQSNLGSAA